jgi:hypothetical protein
MEGREREKFLARATVTKNVKTAFTTLHLEWKHSVVREISAQFVQAEYGGPRGSDEGRLCQ